MKNRASYLRNRATHDCRTRVLCVALVLAFIPGLRADPLADKVYPCRLKMDLIPLYAVFFDVRRQMRLGLEVQKNMGKRDFVTLHLDAGQYDNYTYYKYYDFFGQTGATYYHRQIVKTAGFHMLPAWSRMLRKDPKKKLQYYAGITGDLNFFRKRISYYNSESGSASSDIFKQARLGLGPQIGAFYPIGNRLHVEVKAMYIARLLMLQSDSHMKTIKPFKAVWFDDKQRFWFIPQFNICYDF